MRFVLCLLLLMTIGVAASWAQQTVTIEGTVTDAATGDPLVGVNILVPQTTTGTATDASGHYELEVSNDATQLRFSFIGYKTKIVPINGRITINVSLKASTIQAKQLVVVGYGTQEKEDLTGSVAVVDMDALKRQAVSNPTEALQGQASGVTVISSGQPGENPIIRIRGINTFGNNEPLYVVDGVPTQNISTLNSHAIASMQVLKDAAAASIYGSRAANGVIIITTKKGNGDIQVNYNFSYGRAVPPSNNVWDILSPQGMAELKWMAKRNSGVNPIPDSQYGNGDEPVLPDYILPAGASEGEVNEDNYFVIPLYNDPSIVGEFNQIIRANKQGTDWFDETFDPAGVMKHNLSVSGGGDIGNYLFALNYVNQQGTLMNTYNKEYSVRANTLFRVNDNLRIGENLSYSVTQNPTINDIDDGSAIARTFRMQPIIPVYDIAGNFAGTRAPKLGNARSPVALRYRSRNNNSMAKRLFGNIYAEWDITNYLMLRTNFGGEWYSGFGRVFNYPQYENAENVTTNSFSASSYHGRNWTWSNTLTWHRTFTEKHDIKILVGTEAYKSKGRSLGGMTTSYFSFDPSYTNLDNGSGIQTNNSDYYENALLSYFGKLEYSYDGRYLVTATLRRDGSSKFLNNQWGWFPAVSVGWRVSNEKFMQDVTWISDLKLYGGYGIMGNQLNVAVNNPYTLFAADIASSYYPIKASNGSVVQGFRQARIGNPDAHWEKNVSINVGIDAALFNNSLQLSLEYYRKEVRDLLYNPQLIATAGNAAAPFINVGSMRNQGIDASATYYGNISEDWTYNIGVNFTSYENEIIKIAESIEYFSTNSRRFEGSYIIRNEVGHPVSSFYGYKIIGFWDSKQEIKEAMNLNKKVAGYQGNIGIDEKTGNPIGRGRFRYADINDDGQITSADRTFLGNPNPDFTYGINFSTNYKSWDLSMFFYGSYGNELWNQVKWWTDFYASFTGAKSKVTLHDSWTPDNHDATVAIQETESTFSTNGVPNSYYVENASYLKLKSIQLGYTLPLDILNKLGLKNLRIYLQATNLITITPYSGLNPEVGGGATGFGIDIGAYPVPRTYIIGINLSY